MFYCISQQDKQNTESWDMNEDDRLSVQNEKIYKLEFHSLVFCIFVILFAATYGCEVGRRLRRKKGVLSPSRNRRGNLLLSPGGSFQNQAAPEKTTEVKKVEPVNQANNAAEAADLDEIFSSVTNAQNDAKNVNPVVAEQNAPAPAAVKADVVPEQKVAATEPVVSKTQPVAASNVSPLDTTDVFSQMQSSNVVDSNSPSEQMLGAVDSSVFREMAAIERETALLELKAKREKLLAEIEASRATQRRNQLDELERREQITRNRINWEVEQEQAAERRALEIEQAKREMERQDRMEKERIEREKEMAANAVANTAPENNMPEEDIATLYTIEEVRGVGGDLYAVLISSNGTINVREGYPLKNGYKVSKVTTSFVEVKKGDKVELLRFASKENISR